MTSCQNPDGGFGETAAAFCDEAAAGQGPSMAAVTGFVLAALVDSGAGSGHAARRAARFLIDTQQRDGRWDDGGWVNPYVPPDTFYRYAWPSQCTPLSAGESAMTAAFDPAWRRVGDAAIDPMVASLRLGPDVARWLPLSGRNADRFAAAVPRALRTTLEQTATLPPHACLATLARAQAWADAQLPLLSVSLLAGSLPLLFSGAKGAAVLHATRRMLDDVDRRVNETGRFVLRVVEPGGFGPSGQAVRACQTARVIHALVRRRGAGGEAVPINQQDLLGTLLAFSVVAFRCMKRLAARTSARDANDWWHLWSVAGVLLGIDRRLIPSSYLEAEQALELFVGEMAAPSDHARELTAALVDGMARHLRCDRDTPARLVRYLLGEHLADIVGVPALKPARGLFDAQALVRHGAAGVDLLGPRLGRWLLASIVDEQLSRPPTGPHAAAHA
jgi:hypothetical protein